MQRKCNLSLYPRNSHIKHCFYCKARLSDQTSLSAFCSSECLKNFQSVNNSEEPKQSETPQTIRRAEIPNDEWQVAEEHEESQDDILWARQSEYWIKRSPASVRGRRFRSRKTEPKPLILTGHGVRLRVDRGALLVTNGFTHHPQTREEFRFFPGDASMPSRIILIDTNGYLTLDVIQWISSQNVPLVVLNWKGEVTTVCGGDGTQSDPQLRQAQLEAQKNGLGLKMSVQLIKDKLKQSQETLFALPSFDHEPARKCISSIIGKLDHSRDMQELRIYEARAASIYFGEWQGLELNWKGSSRRYVPRDWLRIAQRVSILGRQNRHATHPINAVLNYAYRMLESDVHTAALEAGLDPSIGYLHTPRTGRGALVYDLMEPLRPAVDRIVLRFVLSERFTSKDFLLSPTGICRVHPLLARRVTSLRVDNELVQRVTQQVIGILRQ